MAKTLRSQNKCRDCGYTWYPRGKNLSRACPDCGSREVRIVVNWLPPLAVAILFGWVFLGGHGPSNTAKPSTEAMEARPAPTETSEQLTPPAAVPRTELEIEQPSGPQPTPSLATPANVPQVEDAASTPTNLAKELEDDRIYSDEEISALEVAKRYTGDDPIVRARLGIPSRETKRLIR